MFNFEHEVCNIRDRYLRYFMAFDYFHDGIIQRIEFSNECLGVQLTLSCERGPEAAYRLWENGHKLVKKKDDRCKYHLTFQDSCYFVCEPGDPSPPLEFLNARFKDSARLAVINREAKRRYYHLRIQVTEGYIDLIFSRFAIRRAEGKITLPKKIRRLKPFYNAMERFEGVHIKRVRQLAECGESLERALALQYLGLTGDKDSLPIAKSSLMSKEHGVIVAAVYAIGRLGDLSHLPALLTFTDRHDEGDHMLRLPIARRHVQDAVEHILFRAGNPQQVSQ